MGGERAMQRRRIIEGLSIRYTEMGSGETLLLVHGMPTSSFLWRQVQSRLSDEYRAVALDLLGFGGSEKPEAGDLSLSAQADLVARFALALQVGPLTLIGHDWGGAVAQVVATRYPGVLSRLVLVCSHSEATWPPRSLEDEALQAEGAALRTTVEDLLGRLRGLISSQLARRERLSEDALAGYLSAWATPAAMGAFFQLVHQVGAADLLGRTSLELGSSRVPTLLLWGELDEITPVEEGRRLARSLPASSLEVIPEAGHLLPEEAPEALARAVRSFLRRTPRKY